MTRACRFAASLVLLIGATQPLGGQSQCVSSSGLTTPTTGAIALVSSSSAVSTNLSGAAAIWNNCAGIPTVVANESPSNAITVNVRHEQGPSSRPDGACAGGAPTAPNGTVTGGEITIWDTYGPNPTNPDGTPRPDLANYDCRPHFTGIIAHELGHVFGLHNVSQQSCPNHIMGGAAWNNPTEPAAEECQRVDNEWTTPTEEQAQQQAEQCALSCPEACVGNPPTCPGNGGTSCENNQTCGPGMTSPLILDLGGDGIPTTGVDEGVLFDINGDGQLDRTAWTVAGEDDAILYFDHNQNHQIDGGTELFGDATITPTGERPRHGFDALAWYDQPANGGDGNGAITPADRVWGKLRLWIDRDHDGIMSRAESDALSARHVVQIDLLYVMLTAAQNFGRDASGNSHLLQGTFSMRLTVGQQGEIALRAVHDVFFRWQQQ